MNMVHAPEYVWPVLLPMNSAVLIPVFVTIPVSHMTKLGNAVAQSQRPTIVQRLIALTGPVLPTPLQTGMALLSVVPLTGSVQMICAMRFGTVVKKPSQTEQIMTTT
jgi:hypothetical protein